MDDNSKKEVNFKKKNPNHGQNIKWFRKKIDYSQEYLATLVDEKQQTISDWEKCEYLNDEILARIAQALDIGIFWLRDTVIDSDGNQYYVESSGTNFINYENAHVAYAVHNPLEIMKDTYDNNLSIIQGNYERAIQTLEALLNAERNDKQRVMDRLMADALKHYPLVENSPVMNDSTVTYVTKEEVKKTPG